jgi:hypothetical protein
MEAWEVGVSLILTSNVESAALAIGRHLTNLHGLTRDLERSFKNLGMVIGGALAIQAGEGLFNMLGKVIERTQKLNWEMTNLAKMNVSMPEQAEARRAATQATRNIRGVTETDALGVYGSTRAFLGHQGALDIMEPGLNYAQVAGHSQRDYKKGMESLSLMIRALHEIGGLVDPQTHQFDKNRAAHMLDLFARIMTVTHERVNAQSVLNMAQQGAPALSTLNDRGIVATAIMAQVMGGHRAGTAAMGRFRQFQAGIMTRATAHELAKLDLINPEYLEEQRGRTKRLRDRGGFHDLHISSRVGGVDRSIDQVPGLGRRSSRAGDRLRVPNEAFAPGLQEANRAGPLDFYELIMKKLSEHGVHGRDNQAMAALRIMGVTTTMREAHEYIRNFEQIGREVNQVFQAVSMDAAKKVQDAKDIGQAWENVSASFTNLLNAFAGPNQQIVVDGLNKLSEVIDVLTEKVRATDPERLKNIAIGIGLLGAAMITAGAGAIITAIGAGGWLITGIALWGAALGVAVLKYDQWKLGVLEWLNTLAQGADRLAALIPSYGKALNDWVNSINAQFMAWQRDQIESWKKWYDATSASVSTFVNDLIAEIKTWPERLKEALGEFGVKFIDLIKDAIKKALGGLSNPAGPGAGNPIIQGNYTGTGFGGDHSWSDIGRGHMVGGGGAGGGAGGGGGGAVPGDMKARGLAVMKHLIAKGWTPEAAAAAVGNFQQESYVGKPGVHGDHGTAHGMAQWRFDRFENLKRTLGPGWETNLLGQADFFDSERKQRGGIQAQMHQFKDLAQANQAMKAFERYGDNSSGTRLANARQWLGMWNSQSSDGSTDSPKLGKHSALSFALQHLGEHEIRDRGKLSAFFKSKGMNVDPATTAWCATYANATLAAAGIKGTGSNIANSFLKWGHGIPPNLVAANDVIVEHRGRGIDRPGGHVGIATGRTRMGRHGLEIESIGGNISDRVARDWAPASRVSVRRSMVPPHQETGKPTEIHVHSHLDGRKVASSVTRHQAEFANGPSHGGQGFDRTRTFAGNDSGFRTAV